MEKEIIKEIDSITSLLVEKGFCVTVNPPNSKKDSAGITVVSWSGAKGLNFLLKEGNSYYDVYEYCVKNSQYSILLFDYAILQLFYRIQNGEITNHRLAYFPIPDAVKYQDEEEYYEWLNFADELFTENMNSHTVTIPLRFDYDKEAQNKDHPASHLTLGNYKNCRIPVNKPITPYAFVFFILRNFYYTKFMEEFKGKEPNSKLSFPETITKIEEELPHFRF